MIVIADKSCLILFVFKLFKDYLNELKVGLTFALEKGNLTDWGQT